MKEKKRREARGRGGARSVTGPAVAWVVVLLTACFGCTNPLQEGEQAPAFQLPGLDGGVVSLSEFRGKVVFLHFWATWCPPCLEELPRLLAFSRKQDPGRFVLLPVSVDRGGAGPVKKFLNSWGLDVHGVLDPGGKIARRYGTLRYPETYILDPEGTLREKVIGAGDWDPGYWERFLQEILPQQENTHGSEG